MLRGALGSCHHLTAGHVEGSCTCTEVALEGLVAGFSSTRELGGMNEKTQWGRIEW